MILHEDQLKKGPKAPFNFYTILHEVRKILILVMDRHKICSLLHENKVYTILVKNLLKIYKIVSNDLHIYIIVPTDNLIMAIMDILIKGVLKADILKNALKLDILMDTFIKALDSIFNFL